MRWLGFVFGLVVLGGALPVAAQPIVQPVGTTVRQRPILLWQNTLIRRDHNNEAHYSIKVQSASGQQIYSTATIPNLYRQEFYAFTLPLALTPGEYTWQVSRVQNGIEQD